MKLTQLLLLCATLIGVSLIGTYAIMHRNQDNASISVTGLGEANFTSDLIVWSGSFNQRSTNLKEAYNRLDQDRLLVRQYFKEKGVPDSLLVFSSIELIKEETPQYDNMGRYLGSVFQGYRLTQRLRIESKEVDKIEALSREVTALIDKGVELYSDPPQYYYTKLADLKLKMVAQATQDARSRAEQIAKEAGSDLGDLKQANMGVFQITGQNTSEQYAWGGTFNTASKKKTASITMKVVYGVD